MIVYLLRAVLADLHEEGVELGDDEGDPDAHGEVDQREDHEEDVEADVPVAVAAAMVDASIPAEEEDLRGRRFGRRRPSARHAVTRCHDDNIQRAAVRRRRPREGARGALELRPEVRRGPVEKRSRRRRKYLRNRYWIC